MKRILLAYKDLLGIIYKKAPFMVVLMFVVSVTMGLLTPIGIYVNKHIFDGGLLVVAGEMTFSSYSVYLALFIVIAILPSVLSGITWSYVQPRSLLILRTAYKERMLKKLKTISYEHFENEESVEIIDKAYHRAENSARHLWPMYVYRWISSIIAGAGSVYFIVLIKWWLVFPVLIPFVIETVISFRLNYNIYAEMETYWNKERRYGILGGYLNSRTYAKELKAFGNADYLIGTYKTRLNERNREYERYYYKNLRKILLDGNLTKIAAIGNVIILLVFFLNREISIGLFIAMTGLFFGSLYENLDGCAFIFKWAPYHINSYDYYDKFFKLSDESPGTMTDLPTKYDIEFRDIWFRYPGTETDVLKGLSLHIGEGEKASVIGENGAGKSTLIKLLLGLFQPDKGEIFVGGKNLNDYPLSIRTKIFGPVFQDFVRYSITVKENIGLGDIGDINNDEAIIKAAKRARAHEFINAYETGYDTLLGREFAGGVDISGGQWQRLAIARAFMGNKPVLLLDEATSQLDPMAEAALYGEFSEMAENKTALFITHRLASTMITDRIFVLDDGVIKESGTHEELMTSGGLYALMFNSQKKWYKKETGAHNHG